jgi:hypothetical protein
VRLKVDVIVTVGTAIPALKQLTSVIPIIFAAALDPVGSGLVASLARPGGNVTGLSIQSTELVTKRIEFLRELLRDLRRVAVMGNQGYSAVLLEMREVEAAARTLGLEIDIAEVGRAEDISPTFDKFTSRVQALYVCPDALMNANSVPINTLALGAHLPTMFATRSPFVEGVARPQFGFIGNKQSQHRPQQAKATCDNCTTIWVIHKHKRQLNPGSRIFPSSNIGVYGFFTWRKPIPIINPRIWANRNAVDLTDVSSNSSISISTSTGISISRHQRDIRDGIVVNSRYVPLRWTGRLIYMYRA